MQEIFILMINQQALLLASSHLAVQEEVVPMIKQEAFLNLYRWLSARTIKETFNPPVNYRYPFMNEDTKTS